MNENTAQNLLKQIRIKLILLFLICYIEQTGAQNWAPVPCFNATWQVNTMFVDSLHDELILNFNSIHNVCNTPFKAVVAYNGSNFHDLDIGFQTHDTITTNSGGGLSISSITFSNQTLYGGFFQSVGSTKLHSPGLALWNGIKWDTLQKKAFTFHQNSFPTVYGFLKDNGNLWIYGQFDSLGGIPGRSLYKFDGNSYTPKMIPISNFDWVKKLIKYKGNIYASGFFYDAPSYYISKIAKYDGSTWSSVGNGVKGSFAGVSDMIIYRDTLYLAGGFSKAEGNIANHVMKWDGTNLLDAGFGDFYDWGFVKQLLVYNDRLYAFGNYTHASNQKTFGLAYYENGEWKVSSDSLNSSIENAVVYKNEIYISGAFTCINSDTSIKYLAKLICPKFNCNITRVSEELLSLKNLKVYPNPVHNSLIVEFDDNLPNLNATLINPFGLILCETVLNYEKKQIDLNDFPKGIYFLRLQNNSTQKTFKIIKD